MKYIGAITYLGFQTRNIIKCFEKHNIDVAVKKTKTVFDYIKNSSTEITRELQKSGVYKLNCKQCDKVYLGETGRKLEIRLREYARRCV